LRERFRKHLTVLSGRFRVRKEACSSFRPSGRKKTISRSLPSGHSYLQRETILRLRSSYEDENNPRDFWGVFLNDPEGGGPCGKDSDVAVVKMVGVYKKKEGELGGKLWPGELPSARGPFVPSRGGEYTGVGRETSATKSEQRE